jgi:hypothetical protein
VFDASVSAVLTALLGAFAGALLSRILDEFVGLMQAGQFSSASSAQSMIEFVQVISQNWIRAALLSALMALVARAIVESKVSNP